MPMVRAMRMLAAIEAGTTSGAQLEALLQDPGRLGEWQQLLVMRGQTRRLAASSTAMAAVAASSTAMAAVWASDTATDAVFSSSTARLEVYNSDTALAALQAAPAQVQRKVNSGATLSANQWGGGTTLVPNGTKIIILRRYYSAPEFDYINWGRGKTSTGASNGPTAGSGGRTLYTAAQARGCVSGTYSDNGVPPQTNDATANFVCAANGLRRDSANQGGFQYVYYIPV